jgi:hypothetical protein
VGWRVGEVGDRKARLPSCVLLVSLRWEGRCRGCRGHSEGAEYAESLQRVPTESAASVGSARIGLA